MSIASRIKEARAKTKITQAELALAMASNQSTIAYWENGRSQPDAAKAQKLAAILGITPEWLMFGSASGKPPAPIKSISIAKELPRDLPVRGMAQASGHSAMILTEDPVSFIDRPPGLIGNPGAFAVWVAGKSMQPRFRVGEVIYVNPAKPVDDGCYVLIELTDGGAFVKELLRQTPHKIFIRQYHPHKDLEIDRKDIKSIYRVTGCSES